jgi:hypothetical protein
LADLVADLEEAARRRFARWDGALFSRLVEGPARELAASLQAAGAGAAENEALLEAFLRLGAEGVGLGYLFPSEVGQGFLNEAFFHLIPKGLAAVEPRQRAKALADCFNLGENLEHAPAWWRRMFLRLLAEGASLGRLPALVERAEREAFGEPSERLQAATRAHWVDLGQEDRRFLPGLLHFVAPTVVCVHDRAEARASPPPSTLGVWCIDPPVVLGTMGCADAVGASSDRLDLVEAFGRRDPRASDVMNAAANAWRCGLTLETSQFLVALYPA